MSKVTNDRIQNCKLRYYCWSDMSILPVNMSNLPVNLDLIEFYEKLKRVEFVNTRENPFQIHLSSLHHCISTY